MRSGQPSGAADERLTYDSVTIESSRATNARAHSGRPMRVRDLGSASTFGGHPDHDQSRTKQRTENRAERFRLGNQHPLRARQPISNRSIASNGPSIR